MKPSQKFVIAAAFCTAIASTLMGARSAEAFSLDYLGTAANNTNQYDYNLVVSNGESLGQNSEIILIGEAAISSAGILPSGQGSLAPAGSFSITPDSSITLIDVTQSLSAGNYGFDLVSRTDINNGLEFFVSNSSTGTLTDGSPNSTPSTAIQSVSEPPTTLGLIVAGIGIVFMKQRKKIVN